MTKDDIKDILYEVLDNNKIFIITEERKSVGFTMTTNLGDKWDRNYFHSQDNDITESLLRLSSIGVPIRAEIRTESWSDRSKIIDWTPTLNEWCYSIQIPILN